jgi:ABC-type glycerol-3-phosphate transport system substrate-binding protein
MHLRTRLLSALLVVALLVTGLPISALRAQDSSVTVTVTLPNFIANRITDEVMAEFETQNPGVKFKIVETQSFLPDPSADLDKYYEELEKYVSAADVLLVDANRIAPEATLAGYYLDMSPLVNEDAALVADDFFPSAWQSYRWDKGFWALPFALDTYVMTYDPKAFDDAGIAYPTEQWTFDDLVTAAKSLVQKDKDGKVTRNGIDLFSPQADAYLFRSLLAESLYDTSVVPNAPKLVNPQVETILNTWQELETDGVIGRQFNVAPMGISPAFAIIFPSNDANAAQRQGILLPGGKAGMDVNGFAISAGTQYPKEAYAVAKFLTERAELANGFSTSPARRSLVGQDAGQGIQLNIPEAVQALITQSVENAIPLAEMRFLNYVSTAYTKMRSDKVDAATALQEAEANAQKNQQAALDKKGSVVISVATPVPDAPTTADGRVALKFGLASFFIGPDLVNKEEWDRVIADFVANDPDVGSVEIKQGFEQLSDMVKKYDCVYQPFNAIPNADLAGLLALDPFVDADPDFDKGDVVGDVLTQLTRDGKLWGYPFSIEPAILKYNAQTFDKGGAAAPSSGWTVDDFNNAVRTLKVGPDDPAPFADSNTGGVYLLIMMASFGGIPLDYRTDPPTIAFTDTKNVEAIRQVLDLAKNGYIKYTKLANLIGGFFGGNTQESPAITTDTLNSFGFRLGGPAPGGDNASDPYKSVSYPRGTEFTGASYNIGIGLVSANAKAPEGCYRFFKAISQNAKLFQAMPARRALINNGNTAAVQGEDLVALYNDFDKLLNEPTTVIFPSQFSGGASPSGFLLQYWLYQAFDAYVLEDKDLDTALADAEQKARDFQECAKSLPPLDTSNEEAARDFLKKFGECATKVDPALAAIFNLIR